jgi:hypothetical protein
MTHSLRHNGSELALTPSALRVGSWTVLFLLSTAQQEHMRAVTRFVKVERCAWLAPPPAVSDHVAIFPFIALAFGGGMDPQDKRTYKA